MYRFMGRIALHKTRHIVTVVDLPVESIELLLLFGLGWKQVLAGGPDSMEGMGNFGDTAMNSHSSKRI